MNIERVVYRHYRISEVDLPNVDWMVSDLRKKIPAIDYLNAYSRRERWLDSGRTCFVPTKEEKPAPRGGVTLCFVYLEGIENPAIGVSVCSMSDNFSYHRGRQIAHGRALKSIKNETWLHGPQTFLDMSKHDPRFPNWEW